jgi:hypothetical protein
VPINEIDENSLGPLGDRIGDGGEGEVFVVPSRPSDVYKRFKPAVMGEISESGLRSTIALLDSFNDSERARVLDRTVWPHTIVRNSGRLVGFLMPGLGDDFFCEQGMKTDPVRSLADWNKLAFRDVTAANQNIFTSLPNLSEEAHRENLLKLLHDLCSLFSVLHRHGIVVGDVSGRNIIWTIRGSSPRSVVIDCDGFRRNGDDAVSKPKQTPDWMDPHLVGPTDINSDLYKLSLAVYRGYFAASIRVPSSQGDLHSLTAEDQLVLSMAQQGVGPGSRPSASDWESLFEALLAKERVKDRPLIAVQRGVAPAPKPTNASAESGRPIIPLRPS